MHLTLRPAQLHPSVRLACHDDSRRTTCARPTTWSGILTAPSRRPVRFDYTSVLFRTANHTGKAAVPTWKRAQPAHDGTRMEARHAMKIYD